MRRVGGESNDDEVGGGCDGEDEVNDKKGSYDNDNDDDDDNDYDDAGVGVDTIR